MLHIDVMEDDHLATLFLHVDALEMEFFIRSDHHKH